MRKKLLSLTVAAILLSCFVLVYEADAQRGRGRCWTGKGQGGGFFENSFPGIALTQDQKTSIHNVRKQFFKDTVSLKSDIYKKRLELKTLLLDLSPDAEKAINIQDEMFDLKKQLAHKKLLSKLEVKKILTPEQIAQLPPGCNFGFGQKGQGFGEGRGPRFGHKMW
jgi:Spy/CpxP family protein refolding chaperone